MNRWPTGASSRRTRSAGADPLSATPAANAPTIGASWAASASEREAEGERERERDEGAGRARVAVDERRRRGAEPCPERDAR